MRLPTSLQDLQDRFNDGEIFEFLPFWGHQPSRDDSITQSCLSQWFVAPFVVDGVRYRTAEHFMMASKARLFGDAEAERNVLAAATPAKAKELGREVRGFDEAAWARQRLRIVSEANVAKFSQHANLRDFLLRTGDAVLVEASPVDRIWGVGLAADAPAVRDPNQWRGLNLLGFALMAARHALLDRGMRNRELNGKVLARLGGLDLPSPPLRY